MNDSVVLGMQNIWQIDDTSFAIAWNDGLTQRYRLAPLQRSCPCAGCYDPENHCRLKSAPNVQENVRARCLKSVGNYALRIEWTSGCSAGIYSFSLLRTLGEKHD